MSTIQERLFAVRLALGGGVRPLPLDELAARLNAQEGLGETAYDGPMLSRMERGQRRPTLEDVERFAAVDPKRRGKYWLAWGDTPDYLTRAEPPPPAVELTPDAYEIMPRPADLTDEDGNARGAGAGPGSRPPTPPKG